MTDVKLTRVEERYLAMCKEVDRLRIALNKANDMAEKFEREWYLRGDSIDELARYFESGNGVPVERATILAKDFWRITGLTPND